MSNPTQTITTQVYRVYIRASAQAIWDAITKPEWTERYGYTGIVDYDMRPGGHYKVQPTEQFRAASLAMGNDLPDVIIDGEVLEADPPRKLVTTFRMLMDAATAEAGFTRITHEIKESAPGVCQLTLIHELPTGSYLATIVDGSLEEYGAGGGHAWVLSALKSLLETGPVLAGGPS